MIGQAWIHTAVMLAAAIIGLLLGQFSGFGDVSVDLIEPFLMLMLFLVFLSVDPRRVKDSFRNLRFLSSALLINFVLTPIVAFVLGIVFFDGSIDLRIGLIMLLVTPCTDWYLVFTGVSKGNVELSSTLLPINLFLQIVLMPVYLLLFMGRSVEFDMVSMLASMAFVLVIPFLAATALRILSSRFAPAQRVKGAMDDNCDNLQLFFLCLAIIAMFASESRTLMDNLDVMLLMIVPLVIFFVMSYSVSSVTSRVQRFGFDDTTSLIFTTMARNSPLALAIAVAVFPEYPLVSLVLVIGPLIELPILSITASLRLNLRGRSIERDPGSDPPIS
jgi:ACR3 family arsenite efflux pump ArsB